MTTPEPLRKGVTYICMADGPTGHEVCGQPFIFRRSYDRHWVEQHWPKVRPVPTPPQPCCAQCTCLPENTALAYEAGTFTRDGVRGPDGVVMDGPVQWTEIDRKEATARLDLYLHITRKDT